MWQRYYISTGTFVLWLLLLFNSVSASAHGIEDFVDLVPGEELALSEVLRAGRAGQKIMVTYEIQDTSQHGIQVSIVESLGGNPTNWDPRATVWVPPGSPAGSVVFDMPCSYGGDCGDDIPYKLAISCLQGERKWFERRDDCSGSASMFVVKKPKIENLSCMTGQIGYGAPCSLTLEDMDERVDSIRWYQYGNHLDWLDDKTFVTVPYCATVTAKVTNVEGASSMTTSIGCRP